MERQSNLWSLRWALLLFYPQVTRVNASPGRCVFKVNSKLSKFQWNCTKKCRIDHEIYWSMIFFSILLPLLRIPMQQWTCLFLALEPGQLPIWPISKRTITRMRYFIFQVFEREGVHKSLLWKLLLKKGLSYIKSYWVESYYYCNLPSSWWCLQLL